MRASHRQSHHRPHSVGPVVEVSSSTGPVVEVMPGSVVVVGVMEPEPTVSGSVGVVSVAVPLATGSSTHCPLRWPADSP